MQFFCVEPRQIRPIPKLYSILGVLREVNASLLTRHLMDRRLNEELKAFASNKLYIQNNRRTESFVVIETDSEMM